MIMEKWKTEHCYQIIGWFFDQFPERNEHLMRVSTPAKSADSSEGVIEAYHIKADKLIAINSRAFPDHVLRLFAGWINLCIAHEGSEILDFRHNSSASGSFRLPGQKVYFHCINYVEADHHVSEISFSYLGMLSDLVKTRFQALKVVKQAGITESLSDAALMQVAHALLASKAQSTSA